MTTMLTASGRALNLHKIDPSDICIEDIAVHLSNTHRFAGATAYSVGAHSLHVSHILEERGYTPVVQMAGLLHDAHEAYLGDITSPAKALINHYSGGHLQWIELAIQSDVLKALGYWTAYCAHRQVITHADMVALATERRDLLPPSDMHWPCLTAVAPHAWNLRDMPGTGPEVRDLFLDRWEELRFAIGEQQRAIPRLDEVAP